MQKYVHYNIYIYTHICYDNYVIQYVMIVGGGVSSGAILQRFPEKDWSDTPFIEGIEWVKLLFLRDKFNIVSFPTYVVSFTVLSTARMGLIDGEAGTALLCFDIDRY